MGRMLFVVLVGMGATAQAAQPAARPDLFVLAVGIDRYQPPTNNLSGCVNDALGLARLWQGQAGKLFARVDVQVLTDAEATQAKIGAGLQTLRGKGKTGDWYVILLSGHGGMALHRWAFTAHDRGDVSDAVLLEVADVLAQEGKKVLLVIDACHAGQLRYVAHATLNRHRDAGKGGGIVVMVSSMPAQTSAALDVYSAFARAVEEGLAGAADYDQSQTVTLQELRRFTYNRVYELRLRRLGLPGLGVDGQDCAIDASLSFPEATVLTHVGPTSPPANGKDSDQGPTTPTSLLLDRWTATVMVPPRVPKGLPATYSVDFQRNGAFQASLFAGSRIVAAGEGIYTVTGTILRLHHQQAVDRLAIVGITTAELRCRFWDRELVLRRSGAPKPVDLPNPGRTVVTPGERVERLELGAAGVSVTDELAGRDAPNSAVLGSTKTRKVYLVLLEGGLEYYVTLKSSVFPVSLVVQEATGKVLAKASDVGGYQGAELKVAPPFPAAYRIVVTSLQENARGTFVLRILKASGPKSLERSAP